MTSFLLRGGVPRRRRPHAVRQRCRAQRRHGALPRAVYAAQQCRPRYRTRLMPYRRCRCLVKAMVRTHVRGARLPQVNASTPGTYNARTEMSEYVFQAEDAQRARITSLTR